MPTIRAESAPLPSGLGTRNAAKASVSVSASTFRPESTSAVSRCFNSGGITRSFRLIAAVEFCIAR